MINWLLIIWLGSAVIAVAVILLVTRMEGKLPLGDDLTVWESTVGYIFLIAFSPLLITVGLCFAISYWSWVGLRFLVGKSPRRDKSQDDILVRLVKRRKKYDKSLKGENVNNWPRAWFWGTPEDLIFDIAKKHRTLLVDGFDEQYVWQKLDADRVEHGSGTIPTSLSLTTYIKYRLDIEHPKYTAFGEELLQKQIVDCQSEIDEANASEAWQIPIDALGKRLLDDDVEQLSSSFQESLSIGSRQMQDLMFRMSEGDEMWSFNLPWMEGIALVRDGRAISHVATILKNPA
jgi:hypothetical protein